MRSRLRNTITSADIAELEDIHRRLCKLMVGLNPSSAPHAPLYAAAATVKQCAVDLSGDPAIWRERGTGEQMPSAQAARGSENQCSSMHISSNRQPRT